MKVAASLQELHEKHGIDNVVIACGVFDGVHQGHQKIVKTLLHLAQHKHSVPTILTFDPHPRSVLFPDKPVSCLTSLDQKLELLNSLGVEAAVVVPFSYETASMDPKKFVYDDFLVSGLGFHGICVGSRWRFGKRGKGDVYLLEEFGKKEGFTVCPVEEVQWYRNTVSSSRIRKAIKAGRLKHAARLLTRPYTVRGTVSHGKGVGGNRFNCPTANIADPLIMLPHDGVYAAKARLKKDGNLLPGVVYVGKSPTIGNAESRSRVIEMHLFGFRGDLYDSTIDVEFYDYIRPDRKFQSGEALREQISCDISVAESILS